MKRSWSKLIAAGLASAMLCSAAAGASSNLPSLSDYPTTLLVDGMPVKDSPLPYYQDGEVLIPLRAVLESGGFTVTWDAQTATAVLTSTDGKTYSVDTARGVLSAGTEQLWQDERLTVKDGTTYTSPELLEQIPGLTFQWDAATNAAIVTTTQPEGRTYVYDLGQGSLKNPSRPDTPYQMQGVVGVPDGENRPVVVLLHGAHPIDKASENRYDLGFSYLVNELAEAGYLAVSMNIAINYSFEDGEPNGCERTVQVVEQQMELLARAIGGEQGIFPCDLTGKGNLDQVVLIGHSRAGRDIFEVAERLPDLGVDGLLAVAPALISPFSGELPDVPTSILIPQYDGDVSTLDGAKIYDELENDPERTASTELIYLKGGNHAGFSTALVRPDPFADAESIAATMPAEKQRAFFSQYTKEFLQSVLEEQQTPYADAQELPDQYADCEILMQADVPAKDLFSAVGADAQLTTEKATADWVNASSTVDNTAGAFRLPGGFTTYDLLRIRWDEPDAEISFPCSADLSGYTNLQLDLAQDSSDERNGQQDQQVVVMLQDARGNRASVTLPAGTPALRWQQGEIERIPMWEGEDFLQYSTFTPLGTVRIPLEDFQDVDLSAIREIRLVFPSDAGSIMLREIQAF